MSQGAPDTLSLSSDDSSAEPHDEPRNPVAAAVVADVEDEPEGKKALSTAGTHTVADDESEEDVPKSESASRSTYRDFSRILPDKETIMNSHNSRPKEPTFPCKLHLILSNPEFQDIISWLPHGRSWRILNNKVFEDRVIPLFFRHGRYSSFARQVNGWGFKRVTHGSDYNSYYHEMFLRGMPHLCEKMKRLTTKDAASRKDELEDDVVPDFYAISRAFPLPETNFVPLPVSALEKANAPAARVNPAQLLNAQTNLVERRSLLDQVSLFNPAANLQPDPMAVLLASQPNNALASLSGMGLGGNVSSGISRLPPSLGINTASLLQNNAPANNNAVLLQQLLAPRSSNNNNNSNNNNELAQLLALNGLLNGLNSLGGL